jgi:hypothetical protein
MLRLGPASESTNYGLHISACMEQVDMVIASRCPVTRLSSHPLGPPDYLILEQLVLQTHSHTTSNIPTALSSARSTFSGFGFRHLRRVLPPTSASERPRKGPILKQRDSSGCLKDTEDF